MGQDEPQGEPEPGGFGVPPEHEAGAYANALVVWHTPYEFRLDFGVTLPREPAAGDEPASSAAIRVVSRIRLPLTLMFDALRALNASMTRYEAEWGEIRPPERRGGST